MSSNKLQQDFYLRVSGSSELGVVLNAALEDNGNNTLTGQDMAELTGKKRWDKLPVMFKGWFDNLMVDYDTGDKGTGYSDYKYKFSYVNVAGSSVIKVDQANFSTPAAGGAKVTASEDHEEIWWPDAPPMLKPMDFFRKPNWFEKMRAMVKSNRHISLAGPPGVGKDTAVMQLAAEENIPLVVVGADAGLRKRDLIGSPEIVDGSSYFQVADFAAAAVNGWWAVITEVNAADPDALLLLNGIIETPSTINIRGTQFPVHENFRLFISYNPGLIGTKPLPQSFKDRFYPVKVGFLTENELKSRLEAHGMPGTDGVEDVTLSVNGEPKPWSTNPWPVVVVKFGMAMWQAHENGHLRYQVTVRRLKDAVELMNQNLTNGNIKQALREAVIDCIDSPVEEKNANKVLNDVMQQWGQG